MKEPSFTKQYLKNAAGALGAFLIGGLIFAIATAIIVFIVFALNGFSWGNEYDLCVQKNAKKYTDSTGTYSLIDDEVERKCLKLD